MVIDLVKYGRLLYKHNSCSREEILKYSEDKFRAVVKNAYKASEFYKGLYSSKGIEYGDLDKVNITDLPIINKNCIKDNFFQFPTKPITKDVIEKATNKETLLPKFKDRYIVHTSGSTGVPTNFLYDKRALMILEANFVRLTVQGGERRVGFSDFPIKSLYIAPVGSGYACTALAIFGMEKYKCKSVIINAQKPLDEWVSLIKDYNPLYLSGYPSCLNLVASLQEEGRININPKKIITGGEPLTKDATDYYRRVFGADVIDYYGCTESIFIGAGSSYYDGIYLYDDLNYTEIDEKNRLIVTPLYNRAFPLIRYQLTDIMEGYTKNQYGKLPYTHIDKVMGREEELMWFVNAKGKRDFLHPLFIDDLNVTGITKYQFVQKSLNYFELKCMTSNKSNEDIQSMEISKQIRTFLKNKNLDNVNFNIRFVDRLEASKKTGKIKMVIKEI